MNIKQKTGFLFALLAITTFFSISVNAQVTIGSSEEPAKGAVLDLSKVQAKNLGLLLPQVSLSNLTTWQLSGTAVDGMFVYNTNTSTGVGIYYWKDNQWIALATSAAVANAWSTTGNAGTNAATSFIGTTDEKPLIFKVNNIIAGTPGFPGESGSNNVSFGMGAMEKPTNPWSNNTAIGQNALNLIHQPDEATGPIIGINQGVRNTVVGAESLKFNRIGSDNTVVGTLAMEASSGGGNTAIGTYALQYNHGWLNVAVGIGALDKSFSDGHRNKDGDLDGLGLHASHNVAVGSYALRHNINSNNTAIGHEAAMMNWDGEMLAATGHYALRMNTTGSQNTANGYNALATNTTGVLNTAIGSQSLVSNLDGNWNTAVGAKSLFHNNGEHNTAIGMLAMYENTIGSSNTGIGSGALYSNTVTHWNTGVGTSALWFNKTGEQNTAVGGEALAGNEGGSYNTAVGTRALWSVLLSPDENLVGMENASSFGEASDNTAVGYEALKVVTTGGGNTAMGLMSMFENSEGEHNVAVGRTAMTHNTTGGKNVAIGSASMGSNVTGSGNTAIGYGANIGYEYIDGEGYKGEEFAIENSTVIGAGARAVASNQVVIGNTGIVSIGGFTNLTRLSDGWGKRDEKYDVPGLKFINLLQPMTYRIDWDDYAHTVYSGFSAEAVKAAAEFVTYDFSGVDAITTEGSEGTNGYALRYAEFVVPLVKAVQELSEENESLKTKIEKLTAVLVEKGLMEPEE